MTLQLLRFSTLAVFLGRAWQHLTLEAPYRNLLWDQSLMEGILQKFFSVDWNTYSNNLTVDSGIVLFNRVLGGFFILGVVTLCFWQKPFFKSILKFLLVFLGLVLLLIAFIDYRTADHQWAMFVEMASQFASPFLLLLALSTLKKREAYLREALRWAVACTFFGHAMYAVGYFPVPGSFVDMTLLILNITEEQARIFLKVAGVLDISLALCLIFLGRSKKEPKALRSFYLINLFYGVSWGLATALARVAANGDMDLGWNSLSQWIWELVVRLPHTLLPLILFLELWRSVKNDKVLTPPSRS